MAAVALVVIRIAQINANPSILSGPSS
jgi:hypothetical protein